jgi:hypothetical protein
LISMFSAFFYLSRLLSCAVGAISSLDFLHKITTKNAVIISSVQLVAILSVAGCIYFAMKLTSASMLFLIDNFSFYLLTGAGRAVVYRVSDPSSRLILFDGCFQFLFAVKLLIFASKLLAGLGNLSTKNRQFFYS